MLKKRIALSIFILSTISLLISVNLFYKMAIFLDEYNQSMVNIVGGEFGVALEWLRLVFLAVLVILSGVNVFRKGNK